jgi:hypothetical protein
MEMRRIVQLLASMAFAVLLVSGVAGAQTEGAVLDASSGSEGLPMSYADERGEKLV